MKKLLSLLLTICIILTLAPFAAMAEGTTLPGGSCGESAKWELDNDGELTVSGTGVVTSCPWLGEYADSIKSIEVEKGITALCDNAFSGCKALTKVLLPNGITAIPAGAFKDCVKLTAITLPTGVTSIGDNAFKGCAKLNSIVIRDKVTTIGKDAFSDCTGLTDIVFGGTEDAWNGMGCTIGENVRIHYGCTGIHFTDKVTKPTCTEKGYTEHKCVCGCSYKDAEVAALGHSTELKNVKAATCIAGGYKGDEVCKVCGKTVKEGEKTISLGHDFKNGKCTRCGEKAELGQASPFVDVKDETAYYYNPVLWAYYHTPQITKGVTKTSFGTDLTCTRGQIVTFLWRANGAPDPKNYKNSFVDISKYEYYYKAVLWAVENKITNGVDDTHFAPDKTCTRAEAVTFLWRSQGEPDAASTKCPFKDVSKDAFYYYPMLWAVGKEITKGVDETHFAPNVVCTRAQIVTFLYRAMV